MSLTPRDQGWELIEATDITECCLESPKPLAGIGPFDFRFATSSNTLYAVSCGYPGQDEGHGQYQACTVLRMINSRVFDEGAALASWEVVCGCDTINTPRHGLDRGSLSVVAISSRLYVFKAERTGTTTNLFALGTFLFETTTITWTKLAGDGLPLYDFTNLVIHASDPRLSDASDGSANIESTDKLSRNSQVRILLLGGRSLRDSDFGQVNQLVLVYNVERNQWVSKSVEPSLVANEEDYRSIKCGFLRPKSGSVVMGDRFIILLGGEVDIFNSGQKHIDHTVSLAILDSRNWRWVPVTLTTDSGKEPWKRNNPLMTVLEEGPDHARILVHGGATLRKVLDDTYTLSILMTQTIDGFEVGYGAQARWWMVCRPEAPSYRRVLPHTRHFELFSIASQGSVAAIGGPTCLNEFDWVPEIFSRRFLPEEPALTLAGAAHKKAATDDAMSPGFERLREDPATERSTDCLVDVLRKNQRSVEMLLQKMQDLERRIHSRKEELSRMKSDRENHEEVYNRTVEMLSGFKDSQNLENEWRHLVSLLEMFDDIVVNRDLGGFEGVSTEEALEIDCQELLFTVAKVSVLVEKAGRGLRTTKCFKAGAFMGFYWGDVGSTQTVTQNTEDTSVKPNTMKTHDGGGKLDSNEGQHNSAKPSRNVRLSRLYFESGGAVDISIMGDERCAMAMANHAPGERANAEFQDFIPPNKAGEDRVPTSPCESRSRQKIVHCRILSLAWVARQCLG